MPECPSYFREAQKNGRDLGSHVRHQIAANYASLEHYNSYQNSEPIVSEFA